MNLRRISILFAVFALVGAALYSPGCDKLITEVNNITLIDTTLGKECKACHTDKNDQLIVIPKAQWENSAHANASLLEFPVMLNGQLKTATACGASCHSGDAYVDSVLTGHPSDTTHPSTINCYTCHLPHSVPTNASELDSLRGISLAVTLADGESKYLKDGIGGIGGFGKSTMCANCHRATGAPPDKDQTNDIVLNANFGPHYSAQADVLSGTGGYRFDSLVVISKHSSPTLTDGCIACHFGKGRGYDLGEHTFRLQYHDAVHDTTPYTANCMSAACHTTTSASTFYAVGADRVPASSARGDSIKHYGDTLRYLLQNSFVLNPDDTAGMMYTVGDVLPADGAKILYNYLLYRLDGSKGLHHPQLMNNLLRYSVEQWGSLAPRADFTISDNDVCVGDPVTFTNKSRFTYHTSEWTLGGSGGFSVENSPTHAYDSAGVYSITLKVTNDSTNENSLATKANAITVHGPITARIHVVDSTVCFGSPVTLVDSSIGLPTSHEWYFPETDSTFTGSTVSIYPVRPGEDTVTVVLRSYNSCTPGGDSVMRDIVYIADSTPDARFAWTPTSVDTNTIVQFSDSSTGPPRSWNWLFVLTPDTGRASGQNPTYRFTKVGTWTAVLIVSNACKADTLSLPVSVSNSTLISPAEALPTRRK